LAFSDYTCGKNSLIVSATLAQMVVLLLRGWMSLAFFMRGNGVVTFVLLICENSLSLGVFNFVVWQVSRFQSNFLQRWWDEEEESDNDDDLFFVGAILEGLKRKKCRIIAGSS
jgi:hypothetical protein